MHDCQDTCELLDGGYCSRLDKNMSVNQVALCRNVPGYFDIWSGRGPGQLNTDTAKEAGKVRELPPLHKQVTSFVKAMSSFLADGCRVVDGPEFDRRVAICEACELFIHELGRCSKCGCFGKVKARGKVWTCPEGKWDI